MNDHSVSLNDGNTMPLIGFGLWRIDNESAEKTINEAIKIGYRLIDSAQIYGNEEGLGKAIQSSGVPRKELYITTKIWNSEQGRDATLKSFESSMKKLATSYLDLLLIHWPSPKKNMYVETWKALIELKKEGRVRSIGVSNFNPEHLDRIINETQYIPAVNQIEVHPYFQQRTTRTFHEKYAIQTEAWSPLGQGQLISDPVILKIAEKHGKSAAQIILRWHLEQAMVTIPKSITTSRIYENYSIQGFSLDQEDHALMKLLDKYDGRIGPYPMTANF
jgi:2,5-diketo-D-gluconate reductase A